MLNWLSPFSFSVFCSFSLFSSYNNRFIPFSLTNLPLTLVLINIQFDIKFVFGLFAINNYLIGEYITLYSRSWSKLKADGPSTDGIISVNESLLMKTEIKLDHSHKTFFISEMIILSNSGPESISFVPFHLTTS